MIASLHYRCMLWLGLSGLASLCIFGSLRIFDPRQLPQSSTNNNTTRRRSAVLYRAEQTATKAGKQNKLIHHHHPQFTDKWLWMAFEFDLYFWWNSEWDQLVSLNLAAVFQVRTPSRFYYQRCFTSKTSRRLGSWATATPAYPQSDRRVRNRDGATNLTWPLTAGNHFNNLKL